MVIDDLEDLIAETSATTVEPLLETQDQKGPTCGMYALKMVLDFWRLFFQEEAKTLPDPMKPQLATAPGRFGGSGGQQPTALEKQNAIRAIVTDNKEGQTASIQDLGAIHGSLIGEVFDADALAAIATNIKGFDAKVVTWGTTESMIDIMRRYIDGNIPCLIAYDNDGGDPGIRNGAGAHWAVVFGYYKENGFYHLIATHGWGLYYDWSAESLRLSNEQMTSFARAGLWVRTKDGWQGPGGRPAQELDYQKAIKDPTSILEKVQIPTTMDLLRQIVIVTPKGINNLKPKPQKAKATLATSGTGSGRGEKY